jgi:hypothetical protein
VSVKAWKNNDLEAKDGADVARTTTKMLIIHSFIFARSFDLLK